MAHSSKASSRLISLVGSSLCGIAIDYLLFRFSSLIAILKPYFLKTAAFRLRNSEDCPKEMQDHQCAKDAEDGGRRQASRHDREDESQHRREQPMREAAKRLALRAQFLREYLGDEHPYDSPLPKRM